MARKRTRKVRSYQFTAAKGGVYGTFFFTADSLELAEAHRWQLHADPSSGIECCMYVGPMRGGRWVAEDAVRGFVSADTLEAEYEAHLESTIPAIVHDEADLAEFIVQKGRRPKHGARIKRNMLNPNGGVIEVLHGTPSYCDPSSEAYHAM